MFIIKIITCIQGRNCSHIRGGRQRDYIRNTLGILSLNHASMIRAHFNPASLSVRQAVMHHTASFWRAQSENPLISLSGERSIELQIWVMGQRSVNQFLAALKTRNDPHDLLGAPLTTGYLKALVQKRVHGGHLRLYANADTIILFP